MRDAAVAIPLCLALAACGAKENASHSAANACAGAPDGAVTVINAWMRPAPVGGTTAVYATLCNKTGAADALISVGAAASSVELHATSRTAEGVVSMAPIGRLDLPANGSAALEPGGAHAMLIGLAKAIEEGETAPARFTFEKAPPVEVEAVAMRDESDDHQGH